jgi:hypothetical protein
MANPLALVEGSRSGKRTPQEWCDHGNAYLRGERPAEHGKVAGEYIHTPRRDMHWVLRDGHPHIEWVR